MLIRLAFLLPLLVLLESDREDERPNRTPRPPALANIAATPLPLPAGEVRIGGLWQLRSAEPRFGGLSGLAWDKGALVAVTDSGAVVRWAPPGGLAAFRDLPDGPGLPQRKIHRDSEAIVADSGRRGWWVSFEQFHGIWLFDQGFTRALGYRPVRLRTWWRNWGVEAMVSRPEGLLLLLEDGGEAILLKDGGEERRTLAVSGSIADAVQVGERTLVVVRRVRPWGIVNALGWLEGEDRYRVREWAELPLGRWDNVEALAVEGLQDGATRLWFATDNDRSRRTLLGWMALPGDGSPGQLR